MKTVTDISVTSARRVYRAFSPAQLFASSEDGAWYDPGDLGSLFQDAAGTMPVTAPGDPVGYMGDKSGNGYHATQATAAARPILQQDAGGRYYLDFDGVDDFLSAGDVLDLGASDRTAAFGVQVPDTGTTAFLSKRGFGASAPGWGVRSAEQRLQIEYDDGVSLVVASIGDAAGLADRAVHIAEIEFGTEARSYRNGVLSAARVDLAGHGDSTGARNFQIGGQAPFYADMRLYGTLVREGLLRSRDRGHVLAYLANKAGVAL
jgi:hypothetical protein